MIEILCVYKVLIIGGGDGGTIREISKHSLVKEIHQCELDKVYNSFACSNESINTIQSLL